MPSEHTHDELPVGDDDGLDGCEVDMADEAHVTEDGEQTLALILFADCWGDPAAVDRRRLELDELAAAGVFGDA